MTDVLQGARWQLHEGEAYAWLRSLPDACIDAVITDPPYSSGGFTRGDRTGATIGKYEQTTNAHVHREDFAGDNRDGRSFLAWCTLWMSEALRVAKPGAPFACFSDWRQLPTVTDAIQAGGWVWRGILPWDKTEGVRPQMGRPRAQAEYLVLGSAAIEADDLAEFVVWGSAGAMPPREDVGGFLLVWVPGWRAARRVEDQRRAAERIPELLAVPAAVRFLSCEPLLEGVTLGLLGTIPKDIEPSYALVHQRIDWVIIGGESGGHARPFDLGWAVDLIAECRDVGVACFMKQAGAVPAFRGHPFRLKDRKGGNPDEWPEALRIREFPTVNDRRVA